ncbi:MAG: dockerin type I repeat-containing protein, partial [Clostridia bacterium]|nr:dockerin type I repeat-containing protein [Clostridia bacterium]
AYAGGIAGYNYCETIENCYNTGNVSATSYSSYAYAGGIAGYNYYNNIYYGTITNCYNTGDVSAYASNAYAGGIVGFNDKTIENCYSIGDVAANVSSDDGTAYIGGIAGDSLDGTVTNCYYANNIAKGVGNGYDVTKKCTVEQLKNQDTFKNFDFETVWTMDNEVGYPYPILKDVDMVEVLVYNIDGDYIFGVRAGTKVSALIDGINDCKIYNGENELGDDDLVGTGMVVKLIDGDTVKATYTLIVAGDINGDGKIDSVDYLLIKRSAFGTYTLTEAMNLAGDINGDGLIDSVDYLLIKRICFGTYKI